MPTDSRLMGADALRHGLSRNGFLQPCIAFIIITAYASAMIQWRRHAYFSLSNVNKAIALTYSLNHCVTSQLLSAFTRLLIMSLFSVCARLLAYSLCRFLAFVRAHSLTHFVASSLLCALTRLITMSFTRLSLMSDSGFVRKCICLTYHV